MNAPLELDMTTVSSMVDEYVVVRAARLEQDKVAEAFRTKEEALKVALLEGMKLSSQHVLASKKHSVTLREREEPSVTDWQTLYDHIRATGDFELLQRRPTTLACRERWEAGVAIPGVSKYTVQSLSISTLKKGK